MRVTAYVLAAEPLWAQASVWSYYELVDRLIVTYDRRGMGWNRKPLKVSETLDRLRAIDTDGKMVFSEGDYSLPGRTPFENETHQRQVALNEASRGADWVLQIDTDEVLADPRCFLECITEAHEAGYAGIEYPARWLYQHVKGNLFLERASRLWKVAAGYPGPVAVRSGVRLTHARQADVALYRVDFARRNTDPDRPANAPVHRVIRKDQGIVHYSHVRARGELHAKFTNHGDLHDKPDDAVSRAEWYRTHPYLAVCRTPLLRRRNGGMFLRLSRIKPPNHYAVADLNRCRYHGMAR
jgi:hypothetical protein